ncbi:MAG TPA: hypothetical protein VK041_00575, partial [Opitutales bacterium]|nr:hypothetical protein [Opitutales bacterium]
KSDVHAAELSVVHSARESSLHRPRLSAIHEPVDSVIHDVSLSRPHDSLGSAVHAAIVSRVAPVDEFPDAAWLKLNNITDPYADSSGDGRPDWEAYVTRTDPHDPEQRFAVDTTERDSEGRIVISWRSVPGLIYRVQWNISLSNPDGWEDIATVQAEGTRSLYIDADAIVPQGFYRVVVHLEDQTDE